MTKTKWNQNKKGKIFIQIHYIITIDKIFQQKIEKLPWNLGKKLEINLLWQYFLFQIRLLQQVRIQEWTWSWLRILRCILLHYENWKQLVSVRNLRENKSWRIEYETSHDDQTFPTNKWAMPKLSSNFSISFLPFEAHQNLLWVTGASWLGIKG